jgi:hypothetical protein
MSKPRRALLWLLVPIFSVLAVSSVWATIHFLPHSSSQSTSSSAECLQLQQFVMAEELNGKTIWTQYHSSVLQYKTGISDKARTVQLVTLMADQVVKVLNSDLIIYQEMFKHRACLKSNFDAQLEATISDTQMTIDFLLGKSQIQGQSFDPTTGAWNTDFYDIYESATNYIKQ